MNDQGTVSSSLIVHRLSFNISPNPATEQTMVTVEGLGESGGELTVFDALGRMVWQQKIAAQQPLTTLDVSGGGFAVGVYLVTLRSNGETVAKRLVVCEAD